jgi:putative Ca2+/H+ antiporter (TMEM165/GDT1 family)
LARHPRWSQTSLIAVLAGSLVATYVPPHHVQRAAGALFLILGIWTPWKSFA